MRKLVIILGIPIDCLNMSETLDRIEQMVQDGRATGKVHQIATVNTDFIVKAQFDPELRYLLQHADLLTADGMPLVWGARWQGISINNRVAGADLVPNLAKRAAERGYSIYFLGGASGVADQAASLLQRQFPNLRIAGIYAPAFSPVLEMETSFHEEIRAAKPDILLVAFGNPKQEKWIGMYGRRLGVPVMIGVGGSLDFVAGHMRRAPEWMQRSGFEWLFRLLQEPRRLFHRYVIDLAIFGTFYLRQSLAIRPGPGSTNQQPAANFKTLNGYAVIDLQGRLTKDCLDMLQPIFEKAQAHSPNILVNLSQVEFLDSSVIGALLSLGNQARSNGGELSLSAASNRIQRILAVLNLKNYFYLYPDVATYMADKRSKRSTTLTEASWWTPSPSGIQSWSVIKSSRVLDAWTAPDLIDASERIMKAKPFLIIDLSETVCLTSAGLAALDHLRHKALNLQGEIRIVNYSTEVLRVIKLARYDHLLPLCNDFSIAIY